MSTPSPAAGAGSAAAPSSATATIASRKRPRQGLDEAEEEKGQQAEEAAAQPPATRLYRHALESIFGFLSLADLSRVLTVSRSWSSAVDSMRSIDGVAESVPADVPLATLYASRLARHIGTLGSEDQELALSQESLHSVGLHLNGLHTLYFKPSSPIDETLHFPPSLTRLEVTDLSATSSPLEANVLISAASRLPSLQRLSLGLVGLDPLVSFAPLLRSSSLRTLHLPAARLTFTQAQADDLRAIPQLVCVLDAPRMRVLLRVSHELQWQKTVINGPITAEMAGLLASLPKLTDLSVTNCEDVAFLPSLPNLHTLKLITFALKQPLPSPEQLIAGVGQCTQLTSLIIGHSPLTSAHLTALLSCMPVLSKLELVLMKELKSLAFLSSESLQRCLTDLTLMNCRHPKLMAAELRHVFGLQQLTHLTIQLCFADKVNSALLQELTPPSARLPKLVDSAVI